MESLFVKSASDLSQCPRDGAREVCFLGRSNVGKSTLVNALAKAKVARTSKRPGMTQTLNFYSVRGMRLVDLPGYGYAKAAKAKREELSGLLGDYVFGRKNLVAVFHVVDAGVVTADDRQISERVRRRGDLGYYVVANKADKLNQSQTRALNARLPGYMGIGPDALIVVSALRRDNVALLFQTIKGVF